MGPSGMVSPTGELTAQLIGDRVCFAPSGGIGSCAALSPGDTPTFAEFSPDGEYLLVGGRSEAGDGGLCAGDGRCVLAGPRPGRGAGLHDRFRAAAMEPVQRGVGSERIQRAAAADDRSISRQI